MDSYNKKVIIFGINDFAELAHYYLSNDSCFEVVAFCVTDDYFVPNNSFCSLPIENFDTIESKYPIEKYSFFAPMSPTLMNRAREKIFKAIKLKGYNLISYVSSKAIIFDTKIGENSFVLENNIIQPFVVIGDNVILWSGNHIGHHSIVKDHVMFTSQVVLSGHCIVEKYSVFGVNCTIRDGINIAEGTFVGMAACITKNTEAWSMYVGNPAIKSLKSTLDLK